MKQLLVTVLFLMGTATLALAQQPETAAPAKSAAPSQAVAAAPTPVEADVARQMTDKLVAKYQLNADQTKQMYKVQQRKLRTQGELEPLKLSDPVKYRAKMESFQTGTLNSIRRLLQTKEQVELYQKTQTDVRIQRATKRKELTQAGASREAIQDAMLALYAE